MQARIKYRLENWKTKSIFKTKEKKNSQAQIARLEKRLSELESEIAHYKSLVCPQRIPFHTYPAQMVALAVFIVTQGNGSLGCAAKTVAFFRK